MKITEILEKAHEIYDLTRKLNMSCSSLSGTAATVPLDAPFPLSYFKGRKVILHNVHYSFEKDGVVASIKVPYPEQADEAVNFGGEVLAFTINENWFSEID